MKVRAAKRAGFCFGVKRAIDIAFKVAEEKKGGVCTLGPIIHNPQVVEKLDAAGVQPIEDLEALKRIGKVSAVIVRTHGIPETDMGRLSDEGYDIIDATCPFVKKAQYYAKLLREEGYRVIILGDREHPEVKGLMDYAGDGVVVLSRPEDFPAARGRRLGIVVQTTQQVENLRRLVAFLVGRTKELKVYNTICNSTALRLKETEEIARESDVMVVVGGKNSANTTQLAKLCASLGVRTHHIETAGEIWEEWFHGSERVGLTAGASTPDWIINEVKNRIHDMGGCVCNGT
ncbi:MAG: 4-hydroxy-3-methylbut-2-enyl diphosphate reductase [Nitrospirota bacterium]